MPTDPKTPEQIVEEARKEARAGHAECFCETTECAIDRLSRVSMLAGRIQGLRWAYDSSGAGWDDEVVSREIEVAMRQLSELEQDASQG